MFFTLNSFHFVSDYFLSVLEFIKLSCNIYSFCCIRFFTVNHFHRMHIWLYCNKLINYFPFRHVFHFANNFFIRLIKKWWIFWIVTKIKQVLKTISSVCSFSVLKSIYFFIQSNCLNFSTPWIIVSFIPKDKYS